MSNRSSKVVLPPKQILSVLYGIAFVALSSVVVAQTPNSEKAGGGGEQLRASTLAVLYDCASQYSSLHAQNNKLSHQNISSATTCAADRLASTAFDLTNTFLNRKGKDLFGEAFHIDSSLNYSLANRSIQGNLDMVLPLHSFADGENNAPSRLTFLQQGVTSWTNSTGINQNDMRIGIVHRFAFNRGKDVAGAFALLQENLESSHARVAMGMDYSGVWGDGTLTYFKPITDWTLDVSGLMRRPLEGVDASLNLKPTPAISLDLTLGKWEDADNTDQWRTKGRVRFGWKPHTYLNLGVEYGDTAFGGVKTSMLSVALRIPIGDTQKARPRWQGLGLDMVRNKPSSNIWRSVETVRSIDYAEREVIEEDIGQDQQEVDDQMLDRLMRSATLRFLQARGTSGDTAALEVVLASEVPTDVVFAIQLRPGPGDNPARPGADYPEETIEVLIRQGKKAASATFDLPYNKDIKETRMLGASITSAHKVADNG